MEKEDSEVAWGGGEWKTVNEEWGIGGAKWGVGR